MALSDAVEAQLLNYITAEMVQDLAHDINHVLRVVKTAKLLCLQEGGIAEVVVPAAYLHDCFSYDKDHPARAASSKIAADKAVNFLAGINYPEHYLSAIYHAIVAHSYSARITPETLEAKIVQDADRLDALGAIGIARCVQVSAALGSPLYSIDDPFCASRSPDDGAYTIDHFYKKLFQLADLMHTASAKLQAQARTRYMQQYLTQLESEI